jgi:hypothetical protein
LFFWFIVAYLPLCSSTIFYFPRHEHYKQKAQTFQRDSPDGPPWRGGGRRGGGGEPMKKKSFPTIHEKLKKLKQCTTISSL